MGWESGCSTRIHRSCRLENGSSHLKKPTSEPSKVHSLLEVCVLPVDAELPQPHLEGGVELVGPQPGGDGPELRAQRADPTVSC